MPTDGEELKSFRSFTPESRQFEHLEKLARQIEVKRRNDTTGCKHHGRYLTRIEHTDGSFSGDPMPPDSCLDHVTIITYTIARDPRDTRTIILP